MTVETEVRALSFTGDAANVTFPISYPIQKKADLVVTLLLNGGTTPTTQVLGTHYDVVGTGPADTPFDTCNVVMVAAPPAASTLAVGRTVPIIQDTSLRTAGEFSARSHEDALDYRTYVEQEIDDRVEALEALASLVPVGTLGVLVREAHFTTDADSVENTWPKTVVLPNGFIPTIVSVGKLTDVTTGALFKEAVTVDWSAAALALTLRCITGLKPGTEYRFNLLMLSTPVT